MQPSSSTKICQSCGMPMNNHKDFGTDTNTSRNEEYCRFCYDRGEFKTKLPLDKFIEKQVKLAGTRGIPENEARRMAYDTLCKLKRWKK